MGLKIRSAPIYVGQKKLGTVENADFTHNSNDESQTGTEGYIGHSDGADTSELTCNVVVPVKGAEKELKDAIQKKKDVQIQIPLDGDLETVEMRCTMRKYTTDSKTGKMSGAFTFAGGRPE